MFENWNLSSAARSGVLFTGAFIALCGLNGCSGKKSNESRTHIRLAISEEPPRLDSRKATDHTSGAILRMCHDALMSMGPKGAPEYGLAEKYTTSEDGLTYTFYIRPNAKWSNGDALTAYDFEHAWKTLLNPAFEHGDYAYELYCIKNARKIREENLPVENLGVHVKQALILVVQLERPTPYFLDLVSFHTFCPVHHMIDKKNPKWAHDAGEDHACSGPYRLAQWKHKDQLVLEKNQHYWNADNVKVDKVNISIVPDSNTCLSLFESGDIDLMGSSPFGDLPPESISTLKKTKALKSANVTVSFWCALNVEHPLLENKNIRKGLAMAINRRAIAENVVPGLYVETTHVLPAALRRNRKLYFEDGNVSLAREHFERGLAESGISREQFNDLLILTDNKSSYQKIMQAIQQQWRDALGIELQLHQVERGTFLHKVHSRDFFIARGQWGADYFDPCNFLDLFKSKSFGNNAPGWEKPEYTELLEKASMELNREKRQQLLEQAEELLVEEMPIIPIFEQISNLLINPRLKGARQTVLGPLELRETYFEE